MPELAVRIGVFGGTFDPIHFGHLAIARAARDALKLDLVLFVPAARPRLRSEEPAASAAHRAAMVDLALQGLDWAKVSSVDMERPGPAYSVDTVADIRHELGPAAELYLIIGADALETLPLWKEPDKLIAESRLVCVGRPGARKPEELPKGHPGRGATFVEGPMVDVSATDLRDRLATGESVDALLPSTVTDYIRDHRLYQAETGHERTGTNA
ncbi:MAG: nicotinate (nicotinamide) nucleotide adenylyltransferase [Chloroflexi bacterium]|nr:nicotinate (nicotinamide) nucleotide adenylyltransferase [Chloroflexota bacterium]